MCLITFFLLFNRPEVKENKEGADTEKAAEQDKESDKELVKEKVIIVVLFFSCNHFRNKFFFNWFQVDEKIDENKEKEVAAQ